MALPEPEPGLVIRYDFVWSHDQAKGVEQGKDRPACLVAASDSSVSPRFVVILPITHTPPGKDVVGIEIPLKVKQALGLDDLPSWIIVSEYNVDEWPNGGLSPVPGRSDIFSYGFIPPRLFAQVKNMFAEVRSAKRAKGVRR